MLVMLLKPGAMAFVQRLPPCPHVAFVRPFVFNEVKPDELAECFAAHLRQSGRKDCRTSKPSLLLFNGNPWWNAPFLTQKTYQQPRPAPVKRQSISSLAQGGAGVQSESSSHTAENAC